MELSRRVNPRRRRALAVGTLWLLTATTALAADPADSAAPAAPERAADPGDDTSADDPTYLATPPFPGLSRAFRFQLQSRFVPDADLGPGHTSLYRPELRARATVPVSKRAVLQLTAVGGISYYAFRGGDAFAFGGESLLDDHLTLYRLRLAAEGAYWLNKGGAYLIRERERWSLVGGLAANTEFEGGQVSEGATGAGALAVGYEIRHKLRLAAGAALRTDIEGGGLKVTPVGSFRWNITEDLTLRDRGLGAQLEYRLTPAVELFAICSRTSDQYALRDTAGLDELTLSDSQLLTGTGFEWKISRHLRVNLEAGAVAWRRMRVRSNDLGTLATQKGDPTPYFEVRFEVRP